MNIGAKHYDDPIYQQQLARLDVVNFISHGLSKIKDDGAEKDEAASPEAQERTEQKARQRRPHRPAESCGKRQAAHHWPYHDGGRKGSRG